MSSWTHDISFADDGKPYILPTPKSIAQMTNYPQQRPTESVRITTKHSFSFAYGRMEVRAKVPGGDWTFPVI